MTPVRFNGPAAEGTISSLDGPRPEIAATAAFSGDASDESTAADLAAGLAISRDRHRRVTVPL
jgi:hypothetical protein